VNRAQFLAREVLGQGFANVAVSVEELQRHASQYKLQPVIPRSMADSLRSLAMAPGAVGERC